MKWLPDSLRGRLVLLFLGVLLVAQMFSAALHFRDRGEVLKHATGFNSALRIAGLVRVLDSLTPQQRQELVEALDLPPLRMRLLDEPEKFPDNSHESARAELFHQLLHLRLGRDRPVLVYMHDSTLSHAAATSRGWGPPRGLPQPMRRMMQHHMGGAGPAPPPGFSFVVQVKLQDGQWASFAYRLPEELAAWPWDLLIGLLVLLAAVLLVSFFAVRWLTRPLSALAHAADELGKDIRRPALEESGPAEVRRAARAFNNMQRRLSRFVEERTRILAAVSHDLKTPITRMRLRVESIDDEALRVKFERDLDEMQTLVQGSLDFMRGMALQEKTQPVDIDALLESLQGDAEDMGYTVTVSGSTLSPYPGKPLALKRCLRNLVENAIRYGNEARIEVQDSTETLSIRVLDSGPGLPEDALEKVFEPFFRLDSSRNPETGGTGLGLSIARNIARGHGGELTLRNRPAGGGIEALLVLPR
jgi:signal transduction histidine kinase